MNARAAGASPARIYMNSRSSIFLMLISLAISAAISASVASLAHASVDFQEAGQTVTHDCGQDPDVSISGSTSTVTLTGRCLSVAVNGAANTVSIASSEKVAVNGSTNEVHIDATNKIAVVGSNNQVTWKKAIKGKKPKIAVLGVQNSVLKMK
jgi:Protein of unknown function (DUF3060)